MNEIVVRIAGEGRWRLGGHAALKVIEDDRWIARAVDAEHDVEYQYLLVALCRYIRTNGKQLPRLPAEADITVPSPGMTLTETIELLSERTGLDVDTEEDA